MKTKLRYRILLMIAIAWIGVVAWSVQGDGVSFSGFDESNHLGRLALFGRAFQGQMPLPLDTQPVHWPPTYYATALGAHYLLGTHRGVILVSILSLLMAGLGTFIIGKRLSGEPAGTAAAAVLLGTPVCVAYGSFATPDAMLLAAVTWSMTLLLFSDGFRLPLPSFFAGALAGLAMMIKGYAPVYLAAPVFVMLFRRRPAHHRLKARLQGALLFSLGFFLVASWWYGPRVVDLGKTFLFHGSDYFASYRPGHTDAGDFFLLDLVRNWSIPLAVVTLLGLIALVRRGASSEELAVASWFLFPAGVFAMAPATYARFLLPAAPAAALVAVLYLSRWKKQAAGTAMVLLSVYALALGSAMMLAPAKTGDRLGLFAHPPRFARFLEKTVARLVSEGPLLIWAQREPPYLTTGLVDYLAFVHHPKTPVLVWSEERNPATEENRRDHFIARRHPKILYLHEAPKEVPKGYGPARRLAAPANKKGVSAAKLYLAEFVFSNTKKSTDGLF